MKSHLVDYFATAPSSAPLPSLSPHENALLSVIHSRWPTSSLEIAEFLGHSCETRDEKRLLSSRISYHIRKLVEKKHVISKRVGNALIVWPYHVEKLRLENGPSPKEHPSWS